jgi:hypothetical protein
MAMKAMAAIGEGGWARGAPPPPVAKRVLGPERMVPEFAGLEKARLAPTSPGAAPGGPGRGFRGPFSFFGDFASEMD